MFGSRPERASEDAAVLEPRGVRWDAVGVFVVIAYALAWVVALPLWRSGRLHSPFLPVVELAMMLTPSLAALATTFLVLKPERPGRYLGLLPVRPLRRLLAFAAIALLMPAIVAFAALGVGAATGTVRVGLAVGGFTPANLLIPQPPPTGIAASTFTLILLITIPLNSVTAAIAALGEELGWRGLLLPALRPLGTWPALALTGTIWGLWHAPIILLGYQYGRPDLLGVLYMVVLSVLIGALIGWLRMRSNSIWPCALAHGGFNASQSAILLTLVYHPATGLRTPLVGWTGWLAILAAIALLMLFRQYWWADTPDQRRHNAGLDHNQSHP
jgi:membrane protease YdiL (CAAX protease family)